MKVRIRLDTAKDAQKFANIASSVTGNVIITDGKGMRVNGKSLLGALYSMEFEELWCECDGDLYVKLSDFIVV